MSEIDDVEPSTNDYDYESNDDCSVKVNDTLLENINLILLSIIGENKNLKNYNEETTKQKKLVFYSSEIPSISIKNYLYRIQSLSEVEDNTLILSLIYIDRICEKASIILTEFNIYRILFISILISIKYNEDKFYENKFYAKIAGISDKELRKLEIHFLKLIKFELYANKSLFEKYKNYIYKNNAINNDKKLKTF